MKAPKYDLSKITSDQSLNAIQTLINAIKNIEQKKPAVAYGFFHKLSMDMYILYQAFSISGEGASLRALAFSQHVIRAKFIELYPQALDDCEKSNDTATNKLYKTIKETHSKNLKRMEDNIEMALEGLNDKYDG